MKRIIYTFIALSLFWPQSLVFSVPLKSGYSLSIEDVSELALRNSFEVQIAQLESQIAQTDNQQAKSIYDLILDSLSDVLGSDSQCCNRLQRSHRFPFA